MSQPRRYVPGSRALLAPVLALVTAAAPAGGREIPAFARKYGVTCSVCHAPFPRLNAFGARFGGNGFEMAVGETPRDTLFTGDPLLRLQRDLPLAIRFDGYLRGLSRKTGGRVAADLQTPWGIKLLTGGQVADGVSYYLYFYLSERGEVAGLEDAYVQFTDVGGTGVSVILGQFQVSDPIYKRELRLEYEDYQLYRIRVGEARADLTYDRGLLATWSPWEGGEVSVEVVNGQGLREADGRRQYDRDDGKNVAVRVSQALGRLRLGAFAYLGREGTGPGRNGIRVWGPDATVALGARGELNLQFLRRTDSNPFLQACPEPDPCPSGSPRPRDTTVDGLLAELVWGPLGPGGRVFLSALYNRIRADAPVFSVRQGEEGLLARYESIAVGATYLLARNLRLAGEAAWDPEAERGRLTVGVVSAF